MNIRKRRGIILVVAFLASLRMVQGGYSNCPSGVTPTVTMTGGHNTAATVLTEGNRTLGYNCTGRFTQNGSYPSLTVWVTSNNPWHKPAPEFRNYSTGVTPSGDKTVNISGSTTVFVPSSETIWRKIVRPYIVFTVPDCNNTRDGKDWIKAYTNQSSK